MGLFDPTTLEFDVARIQGMQAEVTNTANELSSFKKQLESDLDALKSDWDTPAGKKFMSEVDTDWSTQVAKYIRVLEGINEMLGAAANAYSQLETEVNKLTL